MSVLPKAVSCLLLLGQVSPAAEKAFQQFDHCTYVATDWADGDSFLIKKPGGETMTIRLYGADCIEWHVTDDTDARRLRAQRRYFGITEAKPGAQASIELAKGFGKCAAEKSASLLQQPFTVHTRMQSALGDGRFPRFYAFIECKDGSDLATELVRAGLARAYGVCADGPGERTKEEYRETLADIELQAAKRGAGVWSATIWEKLPGERHAQREEEQDSKIATGQAGLPDDFRINPNLAARDELMKLPRIGEKLANLIIEAREEAPFTQPEDLMRVPGIKQGTLAGLRRHLRFDKQ